MGTVIYDKKGGYTGFLGNVMFQAAATIGIAKKHGMDYVFPYKDFYDVFQLQVPQRSVEELSKMPTVDYAERGFHYSEVNINPELSYNLTGYFQSKKYWAHCEDLIRTYFTFIHSYKTTVQKDSISVSLHVRRGDYLNHPNHHPVLSVDYYNKAIEFFVEKFGKNKICVYVFSDDIQWCSDNIVSNPNVKFGFSRQGVPASLDMFNMSNCQHHIIANSSFSWWGSYLGTHPDKIIIAPPKDKWFGSAYKDWSVDDLYCENFTIL